MTRIMIVVEGETEAEFVREVLSPYFRDRGFCNAAVLPTVIHTSKSRRGGFVNYEHLKRDVKTLLNSRDKDLRVTTMVDFFRCPDNFPGIKDKKDCSHREQVEYMEDCFSREINDRRFFPYIQLHEFEALLFSSNRGFDNYFKKSEAEKTRQIINDFPNPEDINTSPEGAPSKRLKNIRKQYNKVIEGNICALDVGIDKMIEKCPRFKAWVEKMMSWC